MAPDALRLHPIFSILVGLVCAGCTGPEPLIDAGVDGCVEAIEAEELMLTNAERAGAGVEQLLCDSQLALAAELHSQDMCANSYFSHTSLDNRTPGDRITAQGASFTTWGENIAQGASTASAVHSLWMSSAGHRSNILSRSFGRIGIGYVACNGTHIWTQVFTN